jgi:hypothetical protein
MVKLDRNYFKKKANPKAKEASQLTECCNQEADQVILNKNSKDDWEIIEDYCEEQLRLHSGVDTIEPICCKVCGRLMEYRSELHTDKKYFK